MRARKANSDHSPAPEPEATASRESGSIQSVERAFAILREVARSPESVSLVELSRRTGLHNSTIFHLLKTMVGLGCITQVSGSKRYRIGRQLYALAAGALNEIGLVSLVTPTLEKLTRATGECSHFAVRSGANSLIIAKTSGTGMFQIVDDVGTLRPAYCTALGKVVIAALDPSQVERYLQSYELRPFTPRTIVDVATLRDEFERVRREGIAYDDCEFDAEMRCAAAPVRDFTGRVAGALGISGPIWRLSIQVLQEKALQLRAAARELSAELGFNGGALNGAETAGAKDTKVEALQAQAAQDAETIAALPNSDVPKKQRLIVQPG